MNDNIKNNPDDKTDNEPLKKKEKFIFSMDVHKREVSKSNAFIVSGWLALQFLSGILLAVLTDPLVRLYVGIIFISIFILINTYFLYKIQLSKNNEKIAIGIGFFVELICIFIILLVFTNFFEPNVQTAKKLKTVHDLFVDDFLNFEKGHPSKISEPISIPDYPKIKFEFGIVYSSESFSCFGAMYFPPNIPNFYECCKNICNNYLPMFYRYKNIRSYEMRNATDNPVRSENLVFTRRVYIYNDSYLSTPEIDTLTNLFKEQNLVVQFRDVGYAHSKNYPRDEPLFQIIVTPKPKK